MCSLLLAVGLVTTSHVTQAVAQARPLVTMPTGWAYEVRATPAAVRGALILMPGFGASPGDFSDFETPRTGGFPLADSLVRHGIATVLVTPPAGVLFGGPSHIAQLEDTILRALYGLTAAPVPIALGGFSAGGTDAILLAERCGRGACRMPHAVKAVFEVDAPLDWYRLWDNALLDLETRPPRANLAEARLLQRAIEARIGAHPTTTSAAYLAASPLATRDATGGNAQWLAHMAVRAYTEPDIEWWMTNRNGSYSGLNAMDAAALVRQLRLLGNDRAELMVTTGRGFRPDGARHPHSWSIVDQPGLTTWLTAALTR
jgi:hypothetical protein